MSPADNASREGGIGARLQAARTRRGLTPGQAAERLHLDPMVIDALEGERFASLGASVYVRGHLKRYAELLGEPVEELQQLYARSTHSVALPDLTRIAQAERSPADRRRFYVPGVAVLIGFGIMGAVWWVVSDLRVPAAPRVAATAAPATPPTSASPAAARTPAGSAVSAAPAASSGEAPAAGSPGAAPASAAPATAGDGVAAAARPIDDPASGPPATAVPVSTNPVPATVSDTLSPDARVGASPSARPAAAASVPATAEPGTAPAAAASGEGAQKSAPVRLTLRVSADSWVEVYDAAGRRLFYDVVAASGVQRLSGVAPLRVVLGNPPGVALEVNGRATPLPDGLRRAETVQFVVEPSGRLLRARAGAGGG